MLRRRLLAGLAGAAWLIALAPEAGAQPAPAASAPPTTATPPSAPPGAPSAMPAQPPGGWTPPPWGAQPPPWAYGPGAGGWPAPKPPPRLERNSPTLFALGIVTSVVGVAGLVTGGIMAAAARGTCETPRAHFEISCVDTGMRTAGIGVAIVGGILTLAGMPMWIVGNRIVVVEQGTPPARR